MSSNTKAHRRSLKECLRTFLQRGRDGQQQALTVGSGILKRQESCPTLLPDLFSVSSLPDFNSSRFNIDRYAGSIPSAHSSVVTRIWAADYSQQTFVPIASSTTSLNTQTDHVKTLQANLARLATPCGTESEYLSSRASLVSSRPSRVETSSSGRSLLPKTSLRQLVDQESITLQSPLSQLVHACNVPSIYRHGASLQASLASIESHTYNPSTLTIQPSMQNLPLTSETHQVPHRVQSKSTTSSPSSQRAGSGRLYRRGSSRSPLRQTAVVEASSPVVIPLLRRSTKRLKYELPSVNHFTSFCVLDAAAPGCPVTATSHDLRYVFDIGEQFFLNTAALDETDMDIITGQDALGNPVVHFVLYSPMPIPTTGRSRFVLASLLDITSFITDDQNVPELETISEESLVEEELLTPPRTVEPFEMSFELSPEQLLGGCYVPERNVYTPERIPRDDVWLDIATEESRKSRSLKTSPSTTRSGSTTTVSSQTSENSTEDVLDRFLTNEKELYSDFFLLANQPLAENAWEICNVSPRVYTSHDYLAGYLSRTPDENVKELQRRLAEGSRFQIAVRWGAVATWKRLYCIPLYGRSNVTWVCFLVDESDWRGLPWWD